MLVELQKIESGASTDERGRQDVERVIRAAHYLLQNQFAVAGDHGTARHYEVLTQPRFERYFASLFDALGMKFIANATEHWVGIIPDTEVIGWRKLKISETIAMLVFASLWHEGLANGEIEERAVVLVTFNGAYDRYREIVSQNRKSQLDTGSFNEIVKDFCRRGVLGRTGVEEDDDFELEIRPLINRLVPGDVDAKLRTYINDEAQRTAGGDATTEAGIVGVTGQNAEEADSSAQASNGRLITTMPGTFPSEIMLDRIDQGKPTALAPALDNDAPIEDGSESEEWDD